MARRVTDTLVQTIDYEANKQKSLDLPTQGYITRIELLLHLNVTTDATSGGSPNEDALARIVESVRLEHPGKKTFFWVNDGRFLKYKNVIDFKQVAEDELPTSAGVTQDVYAKYYIYWGFKPRDPFDQSIVLPAEELPNLRLTIKWGDETSLGTGYTINYGDITVTIRRLDVERGERIPVLVEPRMEAVEKPIDEIKTDLGFQIKAPVGLVNRESLILVLDSSDNRSDSEVSEYGIVFTKLDQTPYRVNWKGHVREVYMDKELKEQIAGLGLFYWRNIARPGEELGFDATGYGVDDIVFGFTTSRTGGSVKIVTYQLSRVR